MHHIPLMPPMFCSFRLCNLVWPRVWVLTGANDQLNLQERISFGRVTYVLADSIIIPETPQIALLEFPYPDLSLSCLLQPRNLVAIKSSLPQFLKQTLHLLYA